MSFINAIVPMLRSVDDSFVVRLARKDNKINVLIEPHVTLPDPATNDPELAALQAAVAMPLIIRIPDDATDFDAELSNAIKGMQQARSASVSALTAYEEAQAEARNAAGLAAAAKTSNAKSKPGADKATGKAKGKGATAKPVPESTPAPTPNESASAAPPSPAQASETGSTTVPAATQTTIFD